jgi:aryl-alcohol dehydrogenase-like predicted oxidoreductase
MSDRVEEKIGRICIGCEPLGGVDWGSFDEEEISEAIMVGLGLGVNFFDTASIYGLGASEKRLGQLIKIHGDGNEFIATKIGLTRTSEAPQSGRYKIVKILDGESIVKQVDDSLSNLKLEVIPLVYIHYPSNIDETIESINVIEKLMSDGKILNYGLSNFDLDLAAKMHSLLPIHSLQFEASLLHAKDSASIREKINWCKKNGVRSVAYGGLHKGLLTGKFINYDSKVFPATDRRSRLKSFTGEDFQNVNNKLRLLWPYSSDWGISLTNLSINFLLDELFIDSVVVGIKNKIQISEVFLSNELSLTKIQIKILKELFDWS